MKYSKKQFTPELMDKINQIELDLMELALTFTQLYKKKFEEEKVDFGIGMVRDGKYPFEPGYSSCISVGMVDMQVGGKKELIDVLIMPIWSCERYLLGLPLHINIAGSRVVGELIDKSLEEIKEELTENINELLEEA